MIQRLQLFSCTLAFSLLALIAASSGASAQSRRASFGLFGAYVRSLDGDADGSSEALGLQGGYRFTGPLALEGSISRLNEDVGLWFADLSAKAYFAHTDRFEVYALAGPGIFRISEGDLEEDETTVHFGLGAEIGLGERAYLRPEVRGRWLSDDLTFDEGLVDYSLGLGWRF